MLPLGTSGSFFLVLLVSVFPRIAQRQINMSGVVHDVTAA